MIYHKTMFPDTLFSPIKSAENGSHFVFCPGNSQNWKNKRKKKKLSFSWNLWKKKSKKLAAAGFEVMTKKIALYSLPLVIL